MRKLNRRKLVLMLADIFIMIASGALCFWVVSLLQWGVYSDKRTLLATVLCTFFSFVCLYISGAYSKMWRYFHIRDYLSCLLGTAVGIFLSALFCYLVEKTLDWSFWTLYFFSATFGIILFRVLFRRTFLVLTSEGGAKGQKRTLIVGAGQAGRMLVNEMLTGADCPYLPMCLADDDFGKLHMSIQQIMVEGTTEDIPFLCEKFSIETILVAIPSCTEEERQRILNICEKTGREIKLIPYLSELLFQEQPLLSQAQDIQIEDLLGRAPVTFDNQDIEHLIHGKVCMVTGGGGSIGSEHCRQIARYAPRQLIILDIYENNAYEIQQELLMEYGDSLHMETLISSVRDYDKMRLIFDRYRPQIVFHAAAHKHVPLMETVPEEAVKNNVIGTYNIASLAHSFHADKFVLISTDKAVNPTNVMGATKRCCEMLVQYMAQNHKGTDYVTVRFGNVLGSNGSVIPLFRKQIESGRAVTITHKDIIRYFMTIPEAVSLVMQAGAIAKGGEIFVLDMGAPVKIVTLAENLIRQYGKEPYKDVPIRFTGLRPGEKLYEELLMNEEGLQSTNNHKIFIGSQIEIEPASFIEKLHQLKDRADSNDSEGTLEMLQEMVPTFHHLTHEKDCHRTVAG